MIRATLSDGQEIGIGFTHTLGRVYGRSTVCQIYAIDSETKKPVRVLTTGVANCSKRDQFKKETGRKKALARALKLLIPNDRPQYSIERLKVWTAYFERGKHEQAVGSLDAVSLCQGDEE